MFLLTSVNPHVVLIKFGFLHLTTCWATDAALKYVATRHVCLQTA